MSVNGKSEPSQAIPMGHVAFRLQINATNKQKMPKERMRWEEIEKKKIKKNSHWIHHYFQWHLPRSCRALSFLSLQNALILRFIIRFLRHVFVLVSIQPNPSAIFSSFIFATRRERETIVRCLQWTISRRKSVSK